MQLEWRAIHHALRFSQARNKLGLVLLDHEDWFWRTGLVTLDTNSKTAVFYRGNIKAVTFEWDTETYTLHRWNRTITGAQSYMAAGWEPQIKAP